MTTPAAEQLDLFTATPRSGPPPAGTAAPPETSGRRGGARGAPEAAAIPAR